MIFAPDLAEAVLEGRKTVTRRTRRFEMPCRYVVGRDYAVQRSRREPSLGRIVITSVTPGFVGEVNSPREARLEGFSTVAAFRKRWEELHGRYDPGQPVWRIEFVFRARARSGGVPGPLRYTVGSLPGRFLCFRVEESSPGRELWSLIPDVPEQHPFDVVSIHRDDPRLAVCDPSEGSAS